ncbi:hypothetical protein TNCV_4659441 [Trichonephila clavipes]|nr:hypothetical protein TNCV_4659441 [Trichonephila clavipes]
MMPTWLYRQDFAKFSLNRHYNIPSGRTSHIRVSMKHRRRPNDSWASQRVSPFTGRTTHGRASMFLPSQAERLMGEPACFSLHRPNDSWASQLVSPFTGRTTHG